MNAIHTPRERTSTTSRAPTVRWAVATAVLFCAPASSARQAPVPDVTTVEIASRIYLVSEPAANMIVVVGDEYSFVAGLQEPALVAGARALLDSLRAPPVRYAVMMDGDSAAEYGDGGWGRAGALTVAHEMLYVWMRRLRRAHEVADVDARTGSRLPSLGFSNVVQFFMKNEEVHAVHPRSGASRADVVLHLEKAGIAFLGCTFTTDGYPAVDLDRGGSLSGMIETIEFFIKNFGDAPERVEPIVPGRGPLATTDDLRAYGDMLVTVRDRIEAMVKEGKTVAEVLAARPTAEFDAKWGAGPVSPEAFVTMIYRSLATP